MDQRIIKKVVEELKLPALEIIDYSDYNLVDQSLKEGFPEVNPTDKEFYAGKLHAYRLATNRMIEEEKEHEKQKRYKEFTTMWSFDEMAEKAFGAGQAIGFSENFKFVIDDQNKYVFNLLCLYFTNNKKFEESGIGDTKYSLNKGIWLQSPVRGSGKSIMLRCFQINKRSCFGYKHTRELAALFQKKGFEAIDMFVNTIPQPSSPLNFYQQDAGMMYDEMFTGEDKVMHMGSPIYISEYIINSLYDFSTSKKNQKWKFHCTSNADGADIEKVSSINYRSRMIDMFNLIKLDGPDRRRK